MKKLIILLTSLSVVTSASTVTMSCSCQIPPLESTIHPCYDENWNDVTDKELDKNQSHDLDLITLFMMWLSKDLFPNPHSFTDMNDKSTTELMENYFRTFNGDPVPSDSLLFNFKNDFIFIITNYGSMDKNVINEIKENELKEREPNVYLILNLPLINLENIQSEPLIDFQLLFMIKNISGEIIGNRNNNWFYWYDWIALNIQQGSNTQYSRHHFLYLISSANFQRVVTNI